MLVLLVLVPSAGRSQGTVEMALGGSITEETVDRDEDGLFEYLLIGVELIVYVPGSYGLHGEVGDGVTANTGPFELGIGSHDLELRFSGGPLSRTILSGPIGIEVEAYSRDPEIRSRTATLLTSGTYGPDMFEAPSGGTGTEISIVGERVVLTGPVMEVAINKTSPELSFSYSGEAGKGTTASLLYQEVIAYNDLDGDGRWDPDVDEMRYETDLDNVDWEIGTDFTTGYDITLYGILQLQLAGTSTVAAWARMTFSISSDHMDIEEPSQKFDIDIDLWQPLDAEKIAVRHVLSEETGRFELVAGEREEREHSITVVKGGDKELNTYSWTDEIMIGRLDPTEDAEAESWFDISGNIASIWFSYPLNEETQFVHHDPTMSMDPDNVPDIGGDDEFLINRPSIMVGGLVMGAALVAATVLMGRYLAERPSGRLRKGGD